MVMGMVAEEMKDQIRKALKKQRLPAVDVKLEHPVDEGTIRRMWRLF
jgi:hypothetical protein